LADCRPHANGHYGNIFDQVQKDLLINSVELSYPAVACSIFALFWPSTAAIEKRRPDPGLPGRGDQ